MNRVMNAAWTDLERRYVAQAIRLWHHLGAEEFVARTRFKESRRYVVVDQGQQIASKPLLAMAFQLQFAVGPAGPPRLSGGEQTRVILHRLGYELTDTLGEISQKGVTPITVGPDTKFWWVNQTVNFDPVYDDGSLWAPLTNRRGHQVDHWRTLEAALPGDIVFHYASPHIRGLSRVATGPAPALPPRGYEDVPVDTEGNLVLTEPFGEVLLARDRALEILDWGRGPVTATGSVRNGYFFPLERPGALELLQLSDLEIVSAADDGDTDLAELPEHFVGGPSDRLALVAVRAEQRFLRKQQLRRWGNLCSLCGRQLPEELLVGAHIKPRKACSENERMDTRNVSMLACLLGCDALFERGYIVVSERGTIERGGRNFERISDRLSDVVGRECSAFSEESRHYFTWHRQHHRPQATG